MKVSVEELSQLERRLNIEVSAEKVSAAFDSIYKTLQQDVTLKGFRKGKAPLAQIKSIYADRVRGDVINKLIQESYSQALDEHSFDPVGMPNIKLAGDLNEGRAFNFTAQFEVRPEVKLEQYEGLPVEKELLELDPEHTAKTLESIRSSHATRENVLEDRPAQSGDFVVIDFEGTRDGQPIDNTNAKDFELELGSNSFIPGFEDGLLGAKVGQTRTLDLKFPEEYHSKTLAGTPITFKVTIKGLKKKVLPELNDEFAVRMGLESMAKLKETLEEDYKKSEEKRINEEFKNRLLKALVNRNPVPVPKTMFDEQKELLTNDVKGRLAQQGFGEEEFKSYLEKWDNDFNESANFMIQSSFLIHAIAEKENLLATNADVDAKIEEYAKQTGIELSKLKSFYKEGENKARLSHKITEEKVVDLLVSKAKVREVKKKDIKD